VLLAVTLPFAVGVITVTDCDPVFVTLPAVIEAEIVEFPFATPDTTPDAASTVATAVFAEDQTGAAAPENVAPF